MVMDEAARAGRRDWYLLARQRLRRHVEVAWDPVYGGLFRALSIDTHTFLLDKIGWVQQEGLLGIAMALEGATEGVWLVCQDHCTLLAAAEAASRKTSKRRWLGTAGM